MKTKAEINQRINLLKLLKSKYFNAKEFEIANQIQAQINALEWCSVKKKYYF